jgi:hypothetical protein
MNWRTNPRAEPRHPLTARLREGGVGPLTVNHDIFSQYDVF